MRLIFVYNANAGLLAGALDSIHKTLSPSTYACSLCALSYGAFAMKPRWRAWLKSIPLNTHFYHKPDFLADFPAEAARALPLIALDRAGVLEPLLDADALNRLDDLDALIGALAGALESRGLLTPA
jgi:hypothetical protein